MNLGELRRAAAEGDLETMASMDLRLQGALEEDERLGSRKSTFTCFFVLVWACFGPVWVLFRWLTACFQG